MKHNFLKSTLLLVAALCSINMMAQIFELDFSTDPYTELSALPAGAIVSGTARNDVHGYDYVSVTLSLGAGNYKLTAGACGYGNGAGSVQNSDGSVTFVSFNQKLAEGDKCYHQNKTENIVTASFTIDADQTVKIICGQYTPYLKLETAAADKYSIVFGSSTTFEGPLPKDASVVKGEAFVVPDNRTMYKEGYTLKFWRSGAVDYPIGMSFVPEDNMEMTAYFEPNTKDLLKQTEDIEVKWNLTLNDGAPSMTLQGLGATGFIVTQVNVGTEQQDVKLTINAESGKFDNSYNAGWAQVNAGTLFSFPSKAGAAVEVYTYAEPSEDCSLDGQFYPVVGSRSGNVATFSPAAPVSNLSYLNSMKEGQYFAWINVRLPKETATGIEEPTSDSSMKGREAKILRNGQLFILRDGKTYNALGAEVK